MPSDPSTLIALRSAIESAAEGPEQDLVDRLRVAVSGASPEQPVIVKVMCLRPSSGPPTADPAPDQGTRDLSD